MTVCRTGAGSARPVVSIIDPLKWRDAAIVAPAQNIFQGRDEIAAN